MWFVHAFNKGERYCLEKHTIRKHTCVQGNIARHTSQGSVYRHAGRVLACAKPKVSQPFRKETWGTWTVEEKVKAVEKDFDEFMATDGHAQPAPLFGTICFHR